MAPKVLYDGAVFEFATPEEVAAFWKAMRNGGSGERVKRAVPAGSKNPDPEKRELDLRALEMVRSSPTALEIAEALRLGDQKGLGPVAHRLKNALRRLDFDPSRVWTSERRPDGQHWVPGPDLSDAIDALRTGKKRGNLL